jgi:hypothetical protein
MFGLDIPNIYPENAAHSFTAHVIIQVLYDMSGQIVGQFSGS